MPELGAEAAEQAGLNLGRLALVPHPGERWFAIAAAMAEVMPVVAVRPGSRVRDGDAARLAARLRSSGTVLLVAGPWPRVGGHPGHLGAALVGNRVGARLSEGPGGAGDRHLKRFPAPRQIRLSLPDDTGRLSAMPVRPHGDGTVTTAAPIRHESGEVSLRVVS